MSDEKEDTSNYYMGPVEEEAIEKYIKSDDLEERNRLYEEVISDVFRELIENIVYTYKFHNLPNSDSLIDECHVWLPTIIEKYDPDKNTKAFSYFSACTRNWFIQKSKKRSKKLNRETTYDDIPNHIEERQLVVGNRYEPKREKREFLKHLLAEIDTWDKGRRGRLLGKNDDKVVEGIRILLENIDQVDILNKKGVYMHLREITGLKTKQITRSLKKLRERYYKFKKKWNKGEVGISDE